MNFNFNFYKYRKIAFFFSFLLMVLSIFLFFKKNLNLGIDFKGGVMVEAKFDLAPSLLDLRNKISSFENKMKKSILARSFQMLFNISKL